MSVVADTPGSTVGPVSNIYSDSMSCLLCSHLFISVCFVFTNFVLRVYLCSLRVYSLSYVFMFCLLMCLLCLCCVCSCVGTCDCCVGALCSIWVCIFVSYKPVWVPGPGNICRGGASPQTRAGIYNTPQGYQHHSEVIFIEASMLARRDGSEAFKQE